LIFALIDYEEFGAEWPDAGANFAKRRRNFCWAYRCRREYPLWEIVKLIPWSQGISSFFHPTL